MNINQSTAYLNTQYTINYYSLDGRADVDLAAARTTKTIEDTQIVTKTPEENENNHKNF